MDQIYADIAARTGGNIYVGVVGPVRTGKSTLIKRIMEELVIPGISDPYRKERARDELPQSGSGKTIMTSEPNFVPEEAVEISPDGVTKLRVRLIDSVGYMVDGAVGAEEDGVPRMVTTPWYDHEIPMTEAAELGTKKVITDHSTIGMVVTTDGSVTELPRENYEEAEERVVAELQELGKPFLILLNTAAPYSDSTESLRSELEKKYGVPVLAVNAAQLKAEDIRRILERMLYQFPLRELRFFFPGWVETLEQGHWLKQGLTDALKGVMAQVEKLADVEQAIGALGETDFLKKAYTDRILPGEGAAEIALNFADGLFYQILSETVEMPIENDYALISTIKMLSETKQEYDKIATALNDVRRKGYGVVTPVFEEITLEKPEVFKQGSRYGIKLRAKGESIHLIKADVETEVSPIIGNEEQSREFIDRLIADYESEPEKIWDLNIFGRTLSSMVSDGMQNKIYRMPEDAQMKLQETLQKIVNEGSGGLICIIL